MHASQESQVAQGHWRGSLPFGLLTGVSHRTSQEASLWKESPLPLVPVMQLQGRYE